MLRRNANLGSHLRGYDCLNRYQSRPRVRRFCFCAQSATEAAMMSEKASFRPPLSSS